MRITEDGQYGEDADIGVRKPVKWRILEVDWNNSGFPCEEQLEGAKNSGDSKIHRPFTEKEKPTGSIEIDLSKDIENENLIFESHVIIAKIVGPKLPRKEIHSRTKENWGKNIMIKFLPKGFFVAVFLEEKERNHVLYLKKWYLNSHPVYMQPWMSNFDPTQLVVYDKSVWIRLFNLPIEYWSESSLEKIGRTLRTLLEIDENIIEGDLYTYARLKIAAVKAIPSSVILLSMNGEWKQQIEVEKDIRACSRCGSVFHNLHNCRIFVRKVYNHPPRKQKQVWKEKEKKVASKILLLEGLGITTHELKQDVCMLNLVQDIPVDMNNDIQIYPIETPPVEVALSEPESDVSKSDNNEDELNMVDPRCISQSTPS
ncbi:hypothetical protein SUGI_0853190 [Cryptomeria japonica]|nr:hypothetical protein SUGI_0853190 [Cryptomeria japonica]